MKIPSMTTSGKQGNGVDVTLLDAVNSAKLVAQSVRVYLSNQRQGTAATKTRGDIDRTKKKWFKQKHTGNARHGARSAPIFVGGGTAHGPHGNANWVLSMSKTMRKAAVKTALALQAQGNNVMAIEGLEDVGTKTKDVMGMLKNVGLNEAKVLIITDTTIPNLIRASQNVGSVLCTRIDRLNAYEVMSAHKILITPAAISALEGKYSKAETAVVEEKAPAKKKTVRKTVKKAEAKTE